MKKIIVVLTILIALLITVFVAAPVLFKGSLLKATKATINRQINAEVEFTDLKVSLLKSFPQLKLDLLDVTVVGKAEFAYDTLFQAAHVGTKMKLSTLYKKSGRSLEELILDNPRLNLQVRANGTANWDLSNVPENPAKKTKTVDESVTAEPFELQLEKIIVQNGFFVYNDREMDMILSVDSINIDISGKMYGSTADLLTNGTAENMGLNYGGIEYISNTALTTKTLLNVDYENYVYVIKESELLVNNLAMDVNGKIELPSDSMFFDLDFATKSSDFKNLLAMVPKEYNSYLKDIQANGQASITGKIKGIYFEENYPEFLLGLNIENGDFQYAGSPEKIKNIKADVKLSKPQGDLNQTVLNIKQAHAEVRNNPVDLTLILKNLMTDPWFDGAFVGKINFDHIKDVLPLDSVNVSGIVDANLFVKGNYSFIEKEQYDKLKSDGIVLLDNFVYDSPSFTQKVYVPKGELKFTPERVNLDELQVKIGSSDLNLSGYVSNYLNYVLKDGVLKGNVQLTSNLLNLNELLLLQKKAEVVPAQKINSEATAVAKEEEEQGKIQAISIPENIDITFKSNIRNAVFDRLPISDVRGLITANQGTIELNGLNMKMLDGDFKLTGSYKNTQQNQPLIDFGIDIVSIDIPLAYKSLSGMRQILPVAGKSQGRLSTKINLNGQLTAEHKFIPSTFNGLGMLETHGLEIIESPIFSQLKGIINSEKLKKVSVGDFIANFSVKNGSIDLPPFKTKVLGNEATIQGNLNAENLVNMRMDFNVPRTAFGPDIQNLLSVIPGNEKIVTVPAGVLITGPVNNPEVKMDLTQTKKTIADASKGEIQNSLNKLGDSLKKLFK